MHGNEYEMARHAGNEDRVAECPFANHLEIERLDFRASPYWHTLLEGRHIGIHRPDDTMCNWTARVLTKDKRYLQKCLGPALDIGRGVINYHQAIQRAFDWFASPKIEAVVGQPRPRGRTKAVNFCPFGKVYSVGHALKDYTDWTRISRSAGGHYNNLILINHHLVSNFCSIPLEQFNATHLRNLALQVLETQPKHGFSNFKPPVQLEDLTPEELRKRKRTFNSLVTILRMAFRQAWESGNIESERPWRCLKRVPVVHSPRRVFLSRDECERLLVHCTPALKLLVLGALYTGCRVGELANLTVEDVGFQGFGIRIEAFKRSPARFVFLPDEGMAFFLSCCENKDGRERVFRSDKGKIWSRQHTGLFRRAVAKAGLPRSFVFHGLRHTYASDLIRNGVGMDVVARQLGHADTRTVAQTYGHLAEQFREQQIRENFTSLGAKQQELTHQKGKALKELWSSLQTQEWRDYAKLEQPNTTPQKSVVSTSREVIELFKSAEMGHNDHLIRGW